MTTDEGSTLRTLLTRWGRQVDRTCPLNDYPRPQLRRDEWQCLNGVWQYAIQAHGDTGVDGSGGAGRSGADAVQRTEYAPPGDWDGEIVVPFSPESALSEVGRCLLPGQTLWYHREVTWEALPDDQRRLLNFGAVDQCCQVWVNGASVGGHEGGYWPFSLDVSAAQREGVNRIDVAVRDDSDRGDQAYGKQKLDRGGIWYTPQSGIWQTVWCEVVPRTYVAALRIEPTLGAGSHDPGVGTAKDDPVSAVEDIQGVGDAVQVTVVPSSPGETLRGWVDVLDGDQILVSGELVDNRVRLPMGRSRHWSPDDPYLYTIQVTAGDDRVTSYVGMRQFGVTMSRTGEPCLTLNGVPIFHNGLLDQGYWSDGLYTAPDDDAMVWELQTLKSLGFNMVRKHIKIEPLRWYHHCDRLGLLVWQDLVSGGGPYKPWVIQGAGWLGVNLGDGQCRYQTHGRGSQRGREVFLRDMAATVELLRDVVGLCVWVPFNEGWGQFDAAEVTRRLRAADPTRLIDHASGYFDQGAGDFDSHHVYFKRFRPRFDRAGGHCARSFGQAGAEQGPVSRNVGTVNRSAGGSSGEPGISVRSLIPRVLALTEFGGYSLSYRGHTVSDREFGYKVFQRESDLERALTRLYERDVLAQIDWGLAAIVYTQVSDVEDEINGLLTYDRAVIKVDRQFLCDLNASIMTRFDSAVGSTAAV
ncbi:MAG: hypothetical protein LBV06_03540 [Propionibacteriaceae bacterium]|jgi:hypothetical protein|nr:hypothetical protein [Propionibacteriaceae bacterium]